MSGWLYLIRNKDLYKIGITKNFESRMRQLKPDKVVAKLYTSDFLKLERELHIRYKKFRIPQTEYFRLNNYHLNEIRQRISKLDYPITIILEIFIKSLFLLLFIFLLIFLFISLSINDFNIAMINSLLLIERISLGLAFISLFAHSGKYFGFWNELKYRTSSLIIFSMLSISIRFFSLFLY